MNKKMFVWIIIGIFLAGLVSCKSSINAYRDGSVWFCEGISTADWPPTDYHEIYYFKGDTVISNKKYLKLYQKYLSKPERYFCSVRTVKDKVFFVPKDRKWELLIFDYGIKPGDIIKIYTTCQGFYTDEYPTPNEIKCLGKSTMESCGNTFEVFTIADVDGNDGRVYDESPGKWIKGIGSIAGPITNDYMQCAGGGSSPSELMVDGKIVWQNSSKTNRLNKQSQ